MLAVATSKHSLGPEDKAESALSSDLSRYLNGVECLGTKSSSNKSNSSMEVSTYDDYDDENDDHL